MWREPEHAALVQNFEIVDFALPGEQGARAVRESLRTCDVVGIKNHGLFSLGGDLHEAASRLEVIEESAKIYLAGLPVGGIPGIGSADAKKIREGYKLS